MADELFKDILPHWKTMSRRRSCPQLFFDDFSEGFAPGAPGSPFSFFKNTAAGVVTNDAAGGVATGINGLTVRSVPFLTTKPTGFDSLKYLVLTAPYVAPDGGELLYEASVAGEQTGLSGLPSILKAATPDSVQGVNNVNSDARLSSSAMVAVDFTTMMVFGFLLTNEDIYVLYERLPFLRTDWGGPGPNYLGFRHVIPVGKRNTADPLNDFAVLGIAYNKTKGVVRWLLNGVEVFVVNRIGLPLQRKFRILEQTPPGQQMDPAKVVTPQSLQFGFGTLSLMDSTNPQNPGQRNNDGLVDLTQGGHLLHANPVVTAVDGSSLPAHYISPYPLPSPSNGTNFGQGNIVVVKYIRVSSTPGIAAC
jgi:hypothetical protein